jgi:hypothetical protein
MNLRNLGEESEAFASWLPGGNPMVLTVMGCSFYLLMAY